ncbi:MAG: hypothetical protein R2771_00495 [Saprospiraceae bacterium]
MRLPGDANMMIYVDQFNGDALFKNSTYSGTSISLMSILAHLGILLMHYAPITEDNRIGNRGY